MSSEDKTVEPSDQGPSPPSSSVGATSTGSPAQADKRPRGRPRKDAAAAAAASLPQAPPLSTSKNRKKGRTRGRVVVDEEDSMDGTEITESADPQDTETQIQPMETVEVVTTEVPEEDKPSSPLAQSPPAEDSAGPSVPASREVKSSERLCAFCYCGGRSLLGQGDLQAFSTTSHLDELLSQKGEEGSTSDGGDGDKTTQPKMAGETTSGQKEKNGSEGCEEEPDPASRFWDELSHVGLPQDLKVQSLFESGQCWAHQSCALWSDGVCEGEGQSLLNVDRAIDSGSTKHCAYCKRLGASIKCCAEGCAQLYHYPCAGAAGTFQDIRSLSLLCPEHIELAIHKFVDDVNCVLCDSPGDLLDQLFCTSCGLHYHGMCLDMAVTPLRRAGWQCPECKVCQTCKNPGEDTKMLVCDTCDKGYHTFCLQPAMDALPTNGWRCKNCRVCLQCGTRTSGQWHHTSLLCEKCVLNQDPALCCPMCACIVDPEHHKDLLLCHTCKRWLHLECERQNSGQAEIHPREDYVCSNCRSPAAEQALQAEDMDTGPELSPQPASMHTNSETGLQLAQKHTDLEPGTQLPPEMHNDPKPELLAVPLHSDPEPVQATVQEEKLATSDQKPEAEMADGVERQVTEPSVNNSPAEFKPETKPAVGAELAPTESPASSVTPSQDACPAHHSTEALQTQDTTLQIKPANTETCPAQGTVNPSTKDLKAIISTTKEPSTASVPFTDQPMEVSLTQPSSTDVVGPSFLETAPKELVEERKEGIFHRNLAETVTPSASSTSEEMDTTLESQPNLSLLSSSSEEKPVKTSVERLAEMVCSPSHLSPVARGTSPRELPQTHMLPSLSDHSGVMPTTTLIPFTPKIGMGKPAITKRKFSPGRPRVKQGAWSPHSSVSSPLSWSPDQPEGWDVPKTRQSSGSPGWSIRVGRGSGFPGRRRPRGAGLSGRAGRGRARGKNEVSPSIHPGVTTIETPYPVKEEEENAMHNTVVIFSSNDSFTLKQDMCVVCGSFGLGAEGRLLACAQCGQCYHPFCVGIKITKVVLSKGWRCLECTVCEACGQATDPGRLLLCDDCDISYHTYCLDPPLQNVPKDSWKCKWCVSCTQCGATTPGLRCEWQNNYTQCAPCASLVTCPVCLVDYSEGTVIVQCRQCDRWFHASCQSLHSEEDVEKAAESSFDCTMCRTFKTTKVVTKTRDITEPLVMTQVVTKARDIDLSRTYTQDGVCLTESGLCQLQSLSATASRRRKPKPKLKLKIINQNSVAVLQAPVDPISEHSRDEDIEDNREAELLDCEAKSDSSLEREPAEDDAKGADGGKKRKRKPYRPGIGGFMVRQRSRPGQGPGKAKRSLCRKDSSGSVSENPFGKDEVAGWTEALPDTPVDEVPAGPEVPEKIKKRYRKKKTKLEEAFPTYLQEAFFGKDLLDKSKQSRQQGGESGLLEDGQSQVERKHSATSFLDPSSDPLLSASTASHPARSAAAQTSEEPLVDLSDVLNTDADILGMLGKPSSDSGLDFCPFQVDSSPPPFAGLDIGPLADSSPVAPHSQAGRRTPRTLPEEPLDGILSPELDKMVTDESILSKLYKIPELEGKDVEDLFTAVLSPSTSQPPPPQVPHPHGPGSLPATPGTSMPHPNAGNPMFPRMPMINGMMGPNQRFPTNPGAGPCIPENFSPLNRMPFTDNPRDRKFNQMTREAVGPWPSPAHGPGPTPPGSLPEGETEAMSNAQRSTLKWEKEETLGELATVAPVLYTNINFPNLKEEYTDWSTRVKQIAKLWRKASSQDRAPYVQKARDNRAALRINKVQMSNETVKRHHPQQQPPEVFDPNIPLDTELLFKDPLKPKESEHEQEWKFRQQMRQKSKQQAKIEATQKLEQVKNEQLQQQQQQQQQTSQSDGDGNNSGNQSPASQPSNGSMSPMQQLNPKESFARPQLPGTPNSGPPEDVFLRPPPPPPSGPSSQPQSPQVFSPGSSGSRPSSPWDPYAKMVGTPRPPTLGPNACRRMPMESGKSPTSLMEQQDRGRPSPAHESFGSPTSMSSDPYAKPPDTPRPTGEMDPFLRPMGPPRGSPAAQGRPPMGSPGRDPYSRPMIRNDAYQRMAQNRMILSDPYSRPLLTPIPGSNESGSVPLFKTPMPPPQAQDPFSRPGPHPSDRFSHNLQNDPYAQPPHTPRPSGNDSFTSPPRMGQHHPQGHSFAQPGPMTQMSRNPYAHAPSTPRPDHFTYDPFAQPSGPNKPPVDPFSQPTGNQRSINEPGAQPRPFFEPYARPPGTPRPHDNYGQPSNTSSPSKDPYSQAPSTPRPSGMNQYSHPSHPGQRMSPSHSMDPYAQPPGTPRPSVGERFSKSPGSQRGPVEPFTSTPGPSRPGSADMFSQPGAPRPMLNDPYAQPPGTPRPGPDLLGRQGPRPGPMGSQDPFSPPQGRLQEPFPHPDSQQPKVPSVSEDGFTQSPSRRPSQTPSHDPFEQAPMTPRPQSTEKLDMKDQSVGGNNGTGPQDPTQLSNNLQMPGASSETQGVALAESEERLRQRQRIRELILKQQQQRSAIRQERGPQEPAGNMTPGTPRPWPNEGPGQQEMFNRPPPPYPGQGPMRGPMRFPGPLPGDQRVAFPNEGQILRGPHPGDPNLRHQGPRFAFPPGVLGPHGNQEFFPRGQHPMQDVPHQLRRSMSAEMAKSMGGNPMGLPQHFPPRNMQVQQHNIMGQPFIELRHRAAENRPRIPFPPGAMQGSHMDPNLQGQRLAGFPGPHDSRFALNQGLGMVEPMGNQPGHLQLSASMDNLHQQSQMPGNNALKQSPLMRSMSQPASNETQNMAASIILSAPPAVQTETVANSESVEEKLDAEESAVKDLEDVEVKDLVDADLENLNLDPEDGKDLDLETNDLHLDDFLTSGKFDIIAYTDPDLDDIKKDMFNEELDLSDPMDDNNDMADTNKNTNAGSEASSSSTSGLAKSEATSEQCTDEVKLEVPGNQDSASLALGQEIKTEVKDCPKPPEVADQQAPGNTLISNQQGVLPDSTPVLSSLLIKQQPEEQSLNPIIESVSQGGNLMAQQNQVTDTQHTSGLAMSQTISDTTTAGDVSMTGFGADHQVGVNPGVDQSGLSQAQQAALNQAMGQHGQHRPLLLEEQPLLLQDLLDQERQEQQQQRQMQAMIRQRSSDSFFPNIDFDAITDPIMKAKMVALKGINKVMVQNNMGMPPMVMNRFPSAPVPPCPESTPLPPQVLGQDGKLTQVARPNPPNFGPGFVNNAQRAQYEEWLQETQQLLQMQQKFLEEKIGAHRRSKKALSAKQRTAKKAGREFPEEDAEQLKLVTEQQGVVQKQLEQIRKQQKEHAELIEEYRVKQQQNNLTPMMPAMHPLPGPAGMMPSGPPIVQPPMNPMMQMPLHPGQPNAPPRMPNPPPGWHSGAPMPMGGPGMPPVIPPQVPVGNPAQPLQMPMVNVPQHAQMPVDPQAPPAPPGGVKPMQAGGVKFDDNNPFSEGFQERERRERLREQQERQRVQLMQEVERQRALKHRMELEQQGMMGPDGNMAPLSQMPFFNAELPQDFMQPQRPPLQQQQQLGPMFPQQQGMQPGMSSPPGTFMQGDRRAMMGNGMMPPDMGPGMGPDNVALQGPNFPHGHPRPRQFSGSGMMLHMPGEGPPFGGDSSTPLPSNFPGAGQSLIQLYSNIIPDEKGKKKRNRKKKKDDDADSVKTPSTPHSDLTAPLTPCVSDTSSTPTRNTHVFGDQDLSRSPLLGSSTPSHSELERQLSGGQSGQHSLSSDASRSQAQEHDRILSNIKLEQTDASECHGPIGSEISSVKEEGNKGGASPFPAGQSPNKGEAGNELLKHLLKNKSTPPPGLSQQRSEESLRSEEEETTDCKSLLRQSSIDSNGAYSDGTPDFPGPLLPEQEKKKGRNKRAPKGGEKPASRYKKRKKEGDERQLMHSGPDTVMTQIKQLSLLPLMEPLIGVNFAHFAPYGSGQLNGENLLSGTFGSASLDGVSDYYSQLAYKQSNLSNPPTPPASLPPTPPPVNRQKMINGFATTEELASKAAAMVSKGLVPKPLHVPFRTEEDLLARAIAQGPKTVDVPASLPTPPHNNQEELSNRGQEPGKDRDTPDSFVPSSSPESVVGMEISRYPDLSLVKEEPLSPCLSPVLPMLPAPDGKGTRIKLQDIKTEPSPMIFGSPFGPVSNDSKQGLVSVAITLRPDANITGVVAAISDLLCVKIPSSYEIGNGGPLSMLGGPRMGPHGMEPRPPMLFHEHGDNGGFHGRPGQMIRPGGLHGMMQQQQAHHFRFHPNSPGSAAVRGPDHKTPASPGCKPQWCCHCKVVVLGNGVQKAIKDLPAHMKQLEGRFKSEEDLVFCSHSCFLLYCSSSSAQSRSNAEAKESVSLLPASEQTESLSKTQHQYSNNMSSLDVHCLAQLQPKQSPPSTPPIPFPMAGETPKMEAKSDALKVTVKLKARPRLHDGWHQGKRQKGLRWRKWTVQVVIPRGNSQLPDEDKIDELLKKLGASLRPPALLRDQRRCCFCHQFGDGITDGPARLLNLDLDVWVHLNCALWSTEVYETQAGALINVELALRRGQTVRCAYCQQTGATSGCHRLRCTNVYHFTCALQAQCTFFKDKTMLCHAHRPRGTAGQALEHELRCFAVFRRVYVQRDEVRQIATAVQQPELGYTFRVGSLVLHAMGQLTPLQMAAFHSSTAIFPVGYEACRIYWSMRHGNRRCRYICSVEDREGFPEFTIRVIEQGYEDLVLTDASAKGVWDKVLGPVAEKRTESGTLKLFPVYLKGEDLFGLTVPAVTKITESLPGVEACDRYSFRYGRNPLVELPLVFNPAGCARAQPRTSSPYASLVIRPQPQAVSSSSARSNQNVAQGEGGAPHNKPPVVHPRSSQYRWMKSEWRANVYLARSRIQGLGLFAARDIEKQTMVIEYNGTILRNEVAIRKEKIYRSQNRAVFMFRIDSEHVVDATRNGGLARYINHSCAPNCVAEVVTFERGYKIIISCVRRIDKGEELCFDYQFDTAEGQHKITCHCGAPECRKWIN
ncbi:histone-lysine N-methyltransferase 2C isoform X4 [Mugil cephalus]|uniref:histone-lysine N-methyltransferase 2C isoform X4 n=1 Tax=Mugil cephalus TaxID=48193 RepID=UPI001FB7C0DD|nr:histone-lysine N-methyltransferase 2C isoform X4 [Mugil cephalus]